MRDALLFLLERDGELDVRHPGHDDAERPVAVEHLHLLHPELRLPKEHALDHLERLRLDLPPRGEPNGSRYCGVVLHVLQKFSSQSASPKSAVLSMLQSVPVLNHDESLYAGLCGSAVFPQAWQSLDVRCSDDYLHQDGLLLRDARCWGGFLQVHWPDGYCLMADLHLLVLHLSGDSHQGH